MGGYDDSQPGAYFVTAVTWRREILFGKVVAGEMSLNRRGEIVQEEWFRSSAIRAEIRLFPDEFVVRPNHIHGIVWIMDSPLIGISAVTTRIRNELNETGVWQRNYHDLIIRDDRDLDRIRKYIRANPSRWYEDAENRP